MLEGKFLKEEEVREREAFGRNRDAASGEAVDAAKDEVVEVIGQEEEVKPMPREHEADRTGDVRSLERKGERNLYLLIQVKDGGKETWRFPEGGLEEGELLHEVRCHSLQQMVTLMMIYVGCKT